MLAKIFENGRSQAIRIPKEYRMQDNEVIINKVGNILLITPKNKGWEMFFDGINKFTDDFMPQGRAVDKLEVRDAL